MTTMTTATAAILLLGRILLAALFAQSAQGHIRNHDRYVQLATGKLPVPALAGVPTGVYLLVADLSIVLGVWADVGALMLVAFLLPTTFLFHRFWTFADPAARRTQASNFWRNISLIGAALVLFAFAVSAPHLPLTVTGAAIRL